MIYIGYKIRALENLKISTSGNQYDNNYSIGYIIGSVLRGSFIRNYINKYNVIDLANDEKARALFFKGGMNFLNGYPLRDDVRTLPFPSCYFTSKDNLKEFMNYSSSKKVLNKNLINELDEEIDDEYQKIKLGEFCINNFDGDLVIENVNKVDTLHISKKEETQGKNSLFRYEAIKAGQEFQAYIAFDGSEEEAKEYVDLLENKIVFLGGSKGSGYGKCNVYGTEILDYNPEIENIDYDNEDYDDEFYLYAISDLISADEYGQPISYVDPKIFEEKLGITDVKLSKASIETTIMSGYNNKWGTRLPQFKGIKGGSVLKYSFKGNIDSEKLTEFIDKGIGLRREDGYGRFIIKSEFDISKVISEKKINDDKIELKDLNEKEQQSLELLFARIYDVQVEKSIDSYIYNISKDIRYSKTSETQVGKLLQNIINITGKTPKEGKEKFKDYMHHLKFDNEEKERTNQKALHQLEDVKIDNKKLTEYLKDIIDKSDNVDNFISNIAKSKPFKIKEIAVKIDEDFAYKNTMIMLERLLRFMLRTMKEA